MPTRLQELLGGEYEEPEQSPRLVEIDDDGADEVFDVLGSQTARRLFAALQAEPRPPAALAEEFEMPLQSVHYHVRRFREADLVEVVGTEYSEKGVEMNVYAPAADPLVVSAAGEETGSRLRAALERLFGVVGVLGAALDRAPLAATRDHLSSPGLGAQAVGLLPFSVDEVLTAGHRVRPEVTVLAAFVAFELAPLLAGARQPPGGVGHALFAALIVLWAAYRFPALLTAGGRVPLAYTVFTAFVLLPLTPLPVEAVLSLGGRLPPGYGLFAAFVAGWAVHSLGRDRGVPASGGGSWLAGRSKRPPTDGTR